MALMAVRVGRPALVVLLGLLSVSLAAAEPAATEKRRTPREIGMEEIVELADAWIMDYDEDDDEKLGVTEMEPLLQQLKAGHEGTAVADQLKVSTLIGMSDSNGDNVLDRVELIDLLKRMKGFDGGHMSREQANKPTTGGDHGDAGYGKSHAERIKSKGKKGKRRKARPKDEV